MLTRFFSGFIDRAKLEPFHENRDKFMQQKNIGDDFLAAIEDIDEFIKNPKVTNLVKNLFISCSSYVQYQEKSHPEKSNTRKMKSRIQYDISKRIRRIISLKRVNKFLASEAVSKTLRLSAKLRTYISQQSEQAHKCTKS